MVSSEASPRFPQRASVRRERKAPKLRNRVRESRLDGRISSPMRKPFDVLAEGLLSETGRPAGIGTRDSCSRRIAILRDPDPGVTGPCQKRASTTRWIAGFGVNPKTREARRVGVTIPMETPMTNRYGVTLALAAGLIATVPASLAAQVAVTDSAEFVKWRQEQKDDVDGLRRKFMAMARAIPADKLGWRPMEGTRSFHDVFAHLAAEGNLEPVAFGRALPAGSVGDFNAEEARLQKLPDDQVIAAMDRGMENLSAAIGGLSRSAMNTPIQFFGQPTFPRVAVGFALYDLHEHLGQLVAYARTNGIVPPWSRGN